MTNEKSGFGILEKGNEVCLLLGKDCIKSPAVLAISASGCYLIAIYCKNIVGKIIVLCRKKFGKSTSFKIPASLLSSSYLSVFIAECTKESWSCFLCYLSLLSKVAFTPYAFHDSTISSGLISRIGFSTRFICYYRFFGQSQDNCFLTESLEK